mgnify:CR=1 FL=1
MNKKIRVPDAYRQDLKDDGRTPLVYPLAASLICHIFLLVLIAFTPSLHFKTPPAQSVINVSMVSLKTAAEATATQSAPERQAPKIEKKTAVKPAVKAPVKAPVKPEPKTAQIPTQPDSKPKTSLKKKTFKSTAVVKQAIRQLEETKAAPTDEQKSSAQSSETLKSALDRLRKEVGKTEADGSPSSGKKSGDAGAKLGKFNEAGKRKAELIDLYRLEVAFQIQKRWAFNDALAGGDQSLVAAIVFKIMPDGEIQDIFFTDRSGNKYLDESAYKAIVKSNPVDPHPDGLNQPYVEMGIRFTPQGIR